MRVVRDACVVNFGVDDDDVGVAVVLFHLGLAVAEGSGH